MLSVGLFFQRIVLHRKVAVVFPLNCNFLRTGSGSFFAVIFVETKRRMLAESFNYHARLQRRTLSPGNCPQRPGAIRFGLGIDDS